MDKVVEGLSWVESCKEDIEMIGVSKRRGKGVCGDLRGKGGYRERNYRSYLRYYEWFLL